MIIDAELTFNQFKNLPHVKNKPLNEQVRYYNDYIEQLCRMRHFYHIQCDNGRSTTVEETISETFFLLQENGDFLLQENNDKILL